MSAPGPYKFPPSLGVHPAGAAPEPRYLLVVGKLSHAAELERALRVKAGEDDAVVYAELLLRERKGIVG